MVLNKNSQIIIISEKNKYIIFEIRKIKNAKKNIIKHFYKNETNTLLNFFFHFFLILNFFSFFYLGVKFKILKLLKILKKKNQKKITQNKISPPLTFRVYFVQWLVDAYNLASINILSKLDQLIFSAQSKKRLDFGETIYYDYMPVFAYTLINTTISSILYSGICVKNLQGCFLSVYLTLRACYTGIQVVLLCPHCTHTIIPVQRQDIRVKKKKKIIIIR